MNSITLPFNELKPALTGLGKVVNRSSTLPILSGIKVERTSDGWVCLTATDLDRFVTVRLEQPDQGTPLAMVVSYEELQRLSKHCGKDESLQIEPMTADSALLKFPLAGQTGEARLKGFPVEEFPVIPKFRGEAVTLPERLRQSLLEAMECASTDPTRYILQSAFIDVSTPDSHYVVGTDGRHLYSSNSFSLALKQSLVLPRHKFLAWRAFILDGNWQVKLAASEDTDTPPWVQLSTRRWRYITRQLHGGYPNWKVAVPDTSATRTTLTLDPTTVEQVQQAIKRLPCHDPDHQTIGIAWESGEAALLARAPEDDAWTRVPLPKVQATGPEQRVFADRRYLAKALDFGLLKIGLIDEMSPLRFTEGGRQMIVMPVRSGGVAEPAPAQPAAPAQADTSEVSDPATAAPEAASPSVVAENAPPADPPDKNPAHAPTGTSATPPPSTQSPIEQVIEAVDELRAYHAQAQDKLRDLGTKLRIINREQKAGAKELQTFRQRLRSLQAVQI